MGLALPAYWCDDSRFQREDLTYAQSEADQVEADEAPAEACAETKPW
jgi:hypothetical protein